MEIYVGLWLCKYILFAFLLEGPAPNVQAYGAVVPIWHPPLSRSIALVPAYGGSILQYKLKVSIFFELNKII